MSMSTNFAPLIRTYFLRKAHNLCNIYTLKHTVSTYRYLTIMSISYFNFLFSDLTIFANYADEHNINDQQSAKSGKIK